MSDIDLSVFHTDFIAQIRVFLAQNRLAHGILLNNIDHLSLEPLLTKITAILLQRDIADELATAADVFYLKSDDGQIKIDQIKNLLEGIYLTSHGAKAKVIILCPLEALNASAANALLKSLEEPPENTYFLMTTNQLRWIMPTLRSRVQVFDLGLTLEQKKAYLAQKYQMNDEDFAKALAISKADLQVIDRIKTDKGFWQLRKELMQVIQQQRSPLGLTIDINAYYQDAIYWLSSLLIDGYYYRFNISRTTLIQDQKDLLENLVNRYDHMALYGFYQHLLKLKAYEGKHYNVNKQLAIESFLIELSV
ncbi:DNA polymerase III subunit delta' C-terminal domain-containing protein [Cysteiniphilum halobium]|uniref:DNA polymerase III subunit delta' C-terminal domain-containing protein n=1 Tax=Cysteiniphilum halobium TaxID=2219059 RepID=UPI003F85C82A